MSSVYWWNDEKIMECLENEIDGLFSLRGRVNFHVGRVSEDTFSADLPFGRLLLKFQEETDEFLRFKAAIKDDLVFDLNLRISNLI